MTEPRKEKPIPFSPEMVRAIIQGRKTQTRRIVRWPFEGAQPLPEHIDNLGDCESVVVYRPNTFKHHTVTSPHIPDDRLWVREAFRLAAPSWNDSSSVEVAAKIGEDETRALTIYSTCPVKPGDGRYRAARFMPKFLSRL